MYADNVYAPYAPPPDYVSAPKYKPIQGTESVAPAYKKSATSVVESEPLFQTYLVASAAASESYVEKPEETAENAKILAVNPIAPVARPEATGAFDIGRYYSISESEVVSGIRGVRNTIANADFYGKTDVERFDNIERKFIDAFGKDFMMAFNLNLPSSWFYMIGVEFHNTLNYHFDDPAQVNRVRLHGDASTEDIKNSIRERFPETLSNRDLFLMVHEMRNSGVLDSSAIRVEGADGSLRFFDTLDLLRSFARLSTQLSDDELEPLSLENRDRRWKSILNNPLIINDLLRLFNAWMTSGKVIMSSDTAPFLVNFLGGVKGSDGLFVVESRSNSPRENESRKENSHYDYGGYYGGGLYAGGYGGEYGGDYGYYQNYVKHANNDYAYEDKDWNGTLGLMMREIDEYNALINSRMQIINEYQVADEGNGSENGGEGYNNGGEGYYNGGEGYNNGEEGYNSGEYGEYTP